jgi:hypothetical protein
MTMVEDDDESVTPSQSLSTTSRKRPKTLVDCLLEFFYVSPGEGAGSRCAEGIISRVTQFGVEKRILATVSDNGSDALSAGRLLSTYFGSEHLRYNITYLDASHTHFKLAFQKYLILYLTNWPISEDWLKKSEMEKLFEHCFVIYVR